MKFALKITTKSAAFYRLLLGEVCPKNSREIGRFFRKFFPKNPAKFDFTFHNQSEDLLYRDLLYQGPTVADAEVLLNIHCISWLLPKSSYSKYGLPQLVMKN